MRSPVEKLRPQAGPAIPGQETGSARKRQEVACFVLGEGHADSVQIVSREAEKAWEPARKGSSLFMQSSIQRPAILWLVTHLSTSTGKSLQGASSLDFGASEAPATALRHQQRYAEGRIPDKWVLPSCG